MWHWFGCWHPWAWHGYRVPYWYPYGGCCYPWGAIPKEEEIAMLERQEKWLAGELDEIRERLEELRNPKLTRVPTKSADFCGC